MSEREPGDRIHEQLELVRPLRKGAMGEVWVAHHLGLDSEVAVKFIHASAAHDPQVVARFSREAKAAAQLKSPHVVRIFDHGVMDDGVPYQVMELLEGESLDDRLYHDNQLPPPLCADILTQTAAALEAAHEAGVVHRDIKPGNVFLCPARQGVFVKLLDFGVARADHVLGAGRKLTHSGVLIGTPTYMSREQVLSPGPVDHRADVWALCVIAYEMLTGDVPFTGDTVGLVCVSVAEGKIHPATEVADVPPAVDAYFQRAFATKIEDRFQSASEAAEAFAAALEGAAPVEASQQRKLVTSSAEVAAEAERTARLAAETLLEPRGELPSANEEAMAPEGWADLADGPVRARRRAVWAWAVVAAIVVALIFWWQLPGMGFAGATVKSDEGSQSDPKRQAEEPPESEPRDTESSNQGEASESKASKVASPAEGAAQPARPRRPRSKEPRLPPKPATSPPAAPRSAPSITSPGTHPESSDGRSDYGF